MNNSQINLNSKINQENYHPKRTETFGKSIEFEKSTRELSFLYIGELYGNWQNPNRESNEPPYHTTELISTAISTNSQRERTMAPLNSTKPDDPQVSQISLSLSLSLSLISFPRSVWLLRKYTIIEQQGFENFSDQPNSRQPNRV